MRLPSALAVATGVLLVSPLVSAERPLRAPRAAQHYDLVAGPANQNNITFARLLLPPNGNTNAVAQSKTIYLNHKGITLSPGDDDSRTNRSSIISSQSQVPAWNTSEANWAATVACFKDLWKEFDITITDQDPGASVPHMEAVFGGYPGNIGMPSGVGGVSPFTEDCAVIENSIVFTFTEVFPDDPQTICEVMAQEVAHSYGLDHEMLASDPMTYLSYNGKRTFKDQVVSCGEFSNRLCGIGGSVCRDKQNSVQLLKDRGGVADLIAPTLEITSPAEGATVAPAFEVAAIATDNNAVTKATLYIDDVLVGEVPGAGPFTFPTDAALGDGPHAIKVEASDGKNVQSQTIQVTVRRGGGDGGSGDGDGDGDGNVHGGCAAGGGSGLALGLLLLVGLRRRR